jgi:hypothetical protein
VTRLYTFPNVYRSDHIEIYVIDSYNADRYKCTLKKAYPKSVRAVDLDYNNRDVMRLQVEFTYKNYVIEPLNGAFEIIPEMATFDLIPAVSVGMPETRE